MEIYVYGTGCGAGELVDTVLPAGRIAAFVDSSPRSDLFLGRPVISPEELAGRHYDLILVTTRSATAVAARCEALGIDSDRLFFLKNHSELRERNRCWETAEAVLGPEYVARLRGAQRLIRRPLWSEREILGEEDLEGDYVRLKTLEALCRELDGLPGAIAELGVYRGGFALVSLDVDLEESTLQGLRWFLPRMNPGGYMLLHDYNSPRLPGVRAAVRRWEAECGRLHAVPLCDVNGTLVIVV